VDRQKRNTDGRIEGGSGQQGVKIKPFVLEIPH
jgi:hypothetical protein